MEKLANSHWLWGFDGGINCFSFHDCYEGVGTSSSVSFLSYVSVYCYYFLSYVLAVILFIIFSTTDTIIKALAPKVLKTVQ